jgi:hypothetical protein
MSTTAIPNPGHELRSLYKADREHACVTHDPLRMVDEVPLQLAADGVVSRFGFSEPCAHPFVPQTVRQARLTSQTAAKPTRQFPHGLQATFTFDMQIPKTTQIRIAIDVLKRFGEHINNDAANEVIELHESPQTDQQAARIGRRMIDQITRIETVVAQLETWHDKLLQDKRPCVSQRIYDRTSLTP